jgi:RimJ/RimL family protein N-acetyltransferase
MTFERTTDYALIRNIITDPKVWPWVGDETCSDPLQFEANEDPRIWYVLAKTEPGRLVGLFTLLPENSVCWELHVALLPESWGGLSHEAEEQFVPWVWAHTDCQRITGGVPTYNPHAKRCVDRMGLREFGFNLHSIRKYGKLWSRHMVGISRPE